MAEQGEQFEALKRIWYQRLRAEGFEDIEDTSHPDQPLKSWHSIKWQTVPTEKLRNLENYYEKARALLHLYQFENEVHKVIWELHSEGLSKRKIEKAIANSSRPFKREWIGAIINIIAAEIK